MVLGAMPEAGRPQPGGDARQFLACRDMDSDMEEIARLLRQWGACAGVQHDQRLAVDAELGCCIILAKDREADRVAPHRQGCGNIDDAQMNRAETGGTGQQFLALHLISSDCSPGRLAANHMAVLR